jgi:hypothetical protein
MSLTVVAAGAASALAVAKPALQFVMSLASRVFRNTKADSLIRFTKATRVEPIVMIDQRIAHLPYTHDVMQALSSIFIGYYLQAIALAVNVGKINVIKLLDTLNPTRDVVDAAAAKIVDVINTPSMNSFESYEHSLPRPGQVISLEAQVFNPKPQQHDNAFGPKPATKADIGKVMAQGGNVGATLGNSVKHGQLGSQINSNMGGGLDQSKLIHLNPDVSEINQGVSQKNDLFAKDTIKSLGEAVNLSVGKLIEVNVSEGDHSATFPISVRLIATIVGSNILAHILGDGSRDTSAKERYHSWRAGQLEFWRDLVLCQDLIDEHKKTLALDTTGTYDAILKRRSGNMAAATLTGAPSVATASNLLVLSKQTARELELSIRGKLSDYHTREKVLKSTYIMLMVVIDAEWEQVTIYHRGISLPTQLSIKEMKTANKGTGPDVGEILKAYQLGMNPTI